MAPAMALRHPPAARIEGAVALLEVPAPPAHDVRELNRRDVIEVHSRVPAGLAQLLANDVDRNAFHRQLGSTGGHKP